MCRDVVEWRHGGRIVPSALSKGVQPGAEVPFHNSVIRNFIVYQDRLEINLLQLFGHLDRMIFLYFYYYF